MKRLILSGIVSIFMMFTNYGIYAQENQVSKTYHQEYPVSNNSSLLIDNKYGSIDVKNWNENKITIDVIVKLENHNKDKAKKQLDQIKVEISQEGNEIKAITDMDENFFTGHGWFNSDNRELTINYTINMPASLDVTLKNKYGDIFINELSGKAEIFLKYGNLKANKIGRGNTEPFAFLSMAYAKGSFEECNWLKIDLKYSTLNIDKSKALVVMSKYSKLLIGDCSSIVAESKYDEYKVEKLSNFVINAAYSGFSFGEISRKIEADIKYGDLKVNKVPASFESIKIENQYGGVKVSIDPSASYTIDGHARYAKIVVPEEGKFSRIEENTSSTISGLIGKDEKTKARVTIETSYGGVKLKD
jgi:Putative adhesin